MHFPDSRALRPFHVWSVVTCQGGGVRSSAGDVLHVVANQSPQDPGERFAEERWASAQPSTCRIAEACEKPMEPRRHAGSFK